MRKKGVALKNRVQRAQVRGRVAQFLAVQQDGTFVGLQETGNHPEQGGLAAARGAQQGQELSLVNEKIDIFEYRLSTERFRDPPDVNDFLCHLLLPEFEVEPPGQAHQGIAQTV